MLLKNINITGQQGVNELLIQGSEISEIGNSIRVSENEITIDLENAVAYPGFINSHDHLDFNLFPQLANRKYDNYTQWGKDIHANNKNEIEKVLRVPQQLRTQYGIYRNLLCGITTVINHGEYLQTDEEWIRVFQQVQSAHSVAFDHNWKKKLNNVFRRNIPFVIHAGEGTDEITRKEIDKLINWNFLGRQMVAVHGVAMTNDQSKKFSALIWCPESNNFLLGKTADISELKKYTKIIFGLDSSLTGSWNLWDHIRTALDTKKIPAAELVEICTSIPAQLWNMKNLGKINNGFEADLVFIKTDHRKEEEILRNTNPENIQLMICRGRIVLVDEKLIKSVPASIEQKRFSKIEINGEVKWVIGSLTKLTKEIHSYYPEMKFPFKVISHE